MGPHRETGRKSIVTPFLLLSEGAFVSVQRLGQFPIFRLDEIRRFRQSRLIGDGCNGRTQKAAANINTAGVHGHKQKAEKETETKGVSHRPDIRAVEKKHRKKQRGKKQKQQNDLYPRPQIVR